MPQLFDVLFDDLRSSKNKVNRLLGVGILFVLIAHFYVVEPYFEYKEQERVLARALKEKETQREILSKQFDAIKDLDQNIKTHLTDVEERIGNFPQHLRKILLGMQNIFSSESSPNAPPQSIPIQQLAPAQQSANIQQSANEMEEFESYSNMPIHQSMRIQQSKPIGEFYLPSNITTFNDGARWYIETWFSDLLTRLQEKIVTPVMQVEIKLDGIKDIDLPKVTQQAMKDIQEYLNGVDSEFWRNYFGPVSKISVTEDLEKVVSNSFSLVKEKVDVLVKNIENAREKKNGELETIKDGLKDSRNHLEKLDSRLDSLESPLGRIPADLPDLIKLFPIIMVGLVVFFTATIRKSDNLHTALGNEFTKNNSNDTDRVTFQRHADCWYLPPYTSVFQPLILIFCVAIIIGIFVRASLLVIAEPDLFKLLTSNEVDFMRRNIFIGTYIFGVLIIFGCLWFIGKIFKVNCSLQRTQ